MVPGMHPGVHAATHPEKAAYVIVPQGTRGNAPQGTRENAAQGAGGDPPQGAIGARAEVVTYAALDAASNRLAHAFRRFGLGLCDGIAICMENSARYYEVVWAAQRSGLYYTARR